MLTLDAAFGVTSGSGTSSEAVGVDARLPAVPPPRAREWSVPEARALLETSWLPETPRLLFSGLLHFQGSASVAMDSETRELRALEAEVAALQRECRMLQNAGEKTSGAWYVARVHPSRPMPCSTRRTSQPSDSSGLRLPHPPPRKPRAQERGGRRPEMGT